MVRKAKKSTVKKSIGSKKSEVVFVDEGPNLITSTRVKGDDVEIPETGIKEDSNG